MDDVDNILKDDDRYSIAHGTLPPVRKKHNWVWITPTSGSDRTWDVPVMNKYRNEVNVESTIFVENTTLSKCMNTLDEYATHPRALLVVVIN